MNPRHSAILASAAFALTACSQGTGSTEVVVRDSAGVQIIEHPAAAIAAAPHWGVGPAQLTVVHAATEEQSFTRVTSATRLSDGRIVLVDADNSGSQVLVFAADGSFERQLGRSGAGPGEFQTAQILSTTVGDTLVMYDFRTSRITRMLPSGALIGTLELSRFGVMAIGIPVGVLADGRLVSTPFSMGDTTQQGSGHFRQRTPIVVVDPVTPRVDTATTDVPGGEMFLSTMNFGGRSASFPTPLGYGRRTLLVTSGAEVHVAANENADLATYALPWGLRRVVRLERARAAVDEAAKQAQRDQTLAELDRMSGAAGPMREMMLDQIQKAQFADSMAYWQTIIGARDGSIWLRELRSAADSTPHYVVVAPDGRVSARVDLPNGARLLWADADRILISLMDADDVPRLECRLILKTGTAE